MHNKAESEMTTKEKIIFYINSHWKAGSILLGALFLVMAGILIWDYVGNEKEEASSMAAEDIQKAFEDWMQETPEDRDDKELNSLINKALSDYPRYFAAQRAMFTRGLMALEKEEWSGAYSAFEELADKWPKSYLAPVGMANAAGAYEEAGELDKAVECWKKLSTEYSEVLADIPEALFNVARLQEKSGSTSEALETYKSIESDFPQSRWAKLAKTRMLSLE